jgi:hypothetical protein
VTRIIGLVFLCGAASCVPALAAPSPATGKPVALEAAPAPGHAASRPVKNPAPKPAPNQASILMLAPADEYFGPLKESIIGIRNSIHDLGARYDFNHDIPVQTLSSAQLQERSIRDWEHKYPRDPQLPRALFLLQRLYTKVLTQVSRDRARVVASWLFRDYASTPQAKQLHKVLAVEHLSPLPSPSPAVSAARYQSELGAQYPSEFNAAPQAPSPAPLR